MMQTMTSRKSASKVDFHVRLENWLINDALNTLAIPKIWYQRAKQRRELAQLPDFLLQDLGITEGQRQVEINKPFWKA